MFPIWLTTSPKMLASHPELAFQESATSKGILILVSNITIAGIRMRSETRKIQMEDSFKLGP